MNTFGDKLFNRVTQSRNLLFIQGELAQLTYQSYDRFVHFINESQQAEIDVTYPVGFNADKTAINTTHKYTKQDLISRYQYLGFIQLPANGIYQLVTIVETLLGDILREVLTQYPSKIPKQKKFDFELVLAAKTLDQVKYALVNSILNELAYKSPREFAEEFNKYVGINLLETPVFHKYIELKATRDIYIHNAGMANEIYLLKAATLARVKAGEFLPVTIQYFLESYEVCLQLSEALEAGLNDIWPSSEYQKVKKQQSHEEQKELAVEKTIKAAKPLASKKLKKKAVKKPSKLKK